MNALEKYVTKVKLAQKLSKVAANMIPKAALSMPGVPRPKPKRISDAELLRKRQRDLMYGKNVPMMRALKR